MSSQNREIRNTGTSQSGGKNDKNKKRQFGRTVLKYFLLFTLVACVAAVGYIIYFIIHLLE